MLRQQNKQETVILVYFDPLKLPLTTILGGVCSYIFSLREMYIRGGGGSSRKQGEMYALNSPGMKMDTGGNVSNFGGGGPRLYISKGVGLTGHHHCC